ncbi:MAG: hypothetical protein H0W40_12850 [Methylibium sp.]|uniref:hypothetical protein n=1 Tax=Methylibium sp. TaxID=2067992 RepID=UPI001818DFB0|nr:hypothetical protein [Methylibium sp.]MBA3598244.1 hypothetical protein [Methylibium sp.]
MIQTPIAFRLATVVASLFIVAPAAAQPESPTPARPEARDPFDARATVPPVRYRSAFSGYRPLSDETVGWKEANDEVARIGGWRAYAREANAPESPASAPAPGAAGDSKAPAPAEHGGHGSHGNKKN